MGWNSSRIKHVARLSYGLGQPPPLSNSGIPIIRATNIFQGKINADNLIYAEKSDLPLDRAPLLHSDEILVVRSGAYTGDSALVTERWAGSAPGYDLRLTPTGADARYLAYCLLSSTVLQQINIAKSRAAQPHLNAEELSDVRIDLPSRKEQQRIADFLDAETARIDRLTALRMSQISLLRDQYEARSRHLITGAAVACEQGSKPLSWIGVIPTNWDTPFLNRLSKFIMGTTFPHEYQGLRTGDYPFIKVADFIRSNELGHLGDADNWVTRETAKELGARIVPAGSILYARVGAALLLNRRRMTTRASVIDDNVRAICIEKGDPRYWLNLLGFMDMGQLMNPGPVPSISESQVSSVRVPNPPLSDQTKIADALEELQRTQHTLRQKIESQLHLLAERRQVLITAAVTGKIDVSTASGWEATDGLGT